MLYEPHPIALEYHPLPDDELRALGEDILVNGLHQKILLYRENGGEPRILDGVQRVRAAVLVDIVLGKDDFEEYTGTDPRGVVASRNLYRRHLTVAQKKEKAKAILKAQPERSDRDIAKEAGFQSHNVVSDIRAEMAAEQPDAYNEAARARAMAERIEANGLEGHKETEHPAPRVERGVKKDGTPRAARGRKPLPAADRALRKEAKKAETKPARQLGTPRENAIAAWEPLFKADIVQSVTDLAMIYKSYEGIIQQRCSATQLDNCLQLIAKAFGRKSRTHERQDEAPAAEALVQ